MFGKNRILSKDWGNGQTLQIVKGSPWLTIQGEGPYAGHAAVFVRLHGCNLRCTFCDTDFDAEDNPVVDIYALIKDIMAIRGAARLVVITGGEPMRQNIVSLCAILFELGFKIQIETAGSLWVPHIEQFADVVCSPKTPTIHQKAYECSMAFKYVISSHGVGFAANSYIPIMATQPGARPMPLASPRPGAPVYLSPMDEYDEGLNKANRAFVAALAVRHNVIAGLQLHKFMEID